MDGVDGTLGLVQAEHTSTHDISIHLIGLRLPPEDAVEVSPTQRLVRYKDGLARLSAQLQVRLACSQGVCDKMADEHDEDDKEEHERAHAQTRRIGEVLVRCKSLAQCLLRRRGKESDGEVVRGGGGAGRYDDRGQQRLL
jgi:hypothetical protein